MLKNIDAKIIKKTIALGSESRVEDVSTLKVAKQCKIAEGTIFLHFKTKANLLNQAFLEIDDEMTEIVKASNVPTGNIREVVKPLWTAYFNYLLANPKKTLFYDNYKRSGYYNVEEHKKSDFVFQYILAHETELKEQIELVNKFSIDVVWMFIIDTSINFAKRIFEGQIENTHVNIETVYNLIFSAILN